MAVPQRQMVSLKATISKHFYQSNLHNSKNKKHENISLFNNDDNRDIIISPK